MSQCSDCYNGCTDVKSDQCIRYTGVDVPILGIKNGDSLSFVEQALITFLVSTLDGTGIKPTIPSEIICTLVSQYLPICEDLSEVDLFKALIQAACNLQEQIYVINATLVTLNADYDISCLSGVSNSSDTHLVLQAVITKLCSVSTDLTALALNVSTNYVALADLNALIQVYLDSLAPSTQFYTKMVPYTILPYFGSLSNFDITGAGTGDWIHIYLCNGLNGTPDFRGRVPVGAISGVSGGTLPIQVNPSSSPFNPNYALGDSVYGVNSVLLTIAQIPAHTHAITDPGHSHFVSRLLAGDTSDIFPLTNSFPIASQAQWGATDPAYNFRGTSAGVANVGLSNTSSTGITGANTTGGGTAHDNKQPSIATYFIMYIP